MDLTLSQAIEDYLMTMECAAYSPRTVTFYAKALRYLGGFAEAHDHRLLVELTPNTVRGAMGAAMRRSEHPSRSWRDGVGMANAIVASAKAMTRHYRNDGFSNVPDLSPVKAIKQPERIQPRLSGPEFHALEQALGRRLLCSSMPPFVIARDHALVQLLVETGLRAAELCALNIADLDFEEGSILVRHGKGGKDRALNIVDPDPGETDGGATLRALAEYLTYRELLKSATSTSALFVTLKGTRPLTPNILRHTLSKLCAEAGISGNRPPHAFRRGWFTTSYQNDPSALPVLVARMGWTTDLMSRVYLRGATIDLARTQHRPSVSKMWRQAAEAREAKPRSTPVQRLEDVHALVAAVKGDPELRRALLQALNGAA
jgi:integrase